MKRYFLGVDIGGTKSHALISDSQGQSVGFGETGSGKRKEDDYTPVSHALGISVGQAMQAAGITIDQIAGAGFGISDYDWPSQHEPHMAAIQSLGLSAPVKLVNDAIPGLVAGTSEGWGISIIAGTGCNCWGRDKNGRLGRVTGFGLRFNEGAGAIEIMERVLQVVASAWYRGGPPTLLTQMLISAVGATSEDDLIEGLTLHRYALSPSYAPQVFDLARQGDKVALDVVTWAGRKLGELGAAVSRQLEFEELEFEVVLSGSLFKAGSLLIEPLENTLIATAPGARLNLLQTPPVVGAVLLGMECGGMDTTEVNHVRPRLLASYMQS